MESSRRAFILTIVLFLLLALLGVWWYFGFSVDFMRFFAAEQIPTTTTIVTEPTPTKGTTPSCVAPPGCTCQVVECIQAPCDPVVVCPSEASQSQSQVNCSPATQTVSINSAARLSAAGGAGTYVWYAPDSIVGSQKIGASTFSVSYGTVGTKKVTVQSARLVNGFNDPANPVIDSVACTVVVQ